MIDEATNTLLIFPYTSRVLGLSPADWAREVLLRLSVPVASFVGLLLDASHLVAVTSVLRLGVVVAVTLSGYALVYATIGPNPPQAGRLPLRRRVGGRAACRASAAPLGAVIQLVVAVRHLREAQLAQRPIARTRGERAPRVIVL
jgi:hypothetical protein